VNLPLGIAALVGLRLRLPSPDPAPASGPLDVAGAALLAAATSCLMLVCVWGGDRYAWASAEIAALVAGAVVFGVVLAVRERRVADPVVPLGLLRTRTVAVASAALFLATAALFAVNVFVPLFLQTTTGATPTEAGLLLVPAMLGITVSTWLAGRAIEKTGRYKRYPLIGLGLMTVALAGLGLAAAHPSRTTVGAGLAVFGLGFGMVGQVLVTAVQNDVDRSRLGTAMAATTFFRGLGGAVGAAVLGAVFTARSGDGQAVIDGVQAVFLCAAPLAAFGLAVTLLLRETPLQGPATTTREETT